MYGGDYRVGDRKVQVMCMEHAEYYFCRKAFFYLKDDFDFPIKFSLFVWYIDFLTTTHVLMLHVCLTNTLFDREIKVYYVTHVLKQGTAIKTICSKSHGSR